MRKLQVSVLRFLFLFLVAVAKKVVAKVVTVSIDSVVLDATVASFEVAIVIKAMAAVVAGAHAFANTVAVVGCTVEFAIAITFAVVVITALFASVLVAVATVVVGAAAAAETASILALSTHAMHPFEHEQLYLFVNTANHLTVLQNCFRVLFAEFADD